MPSSIEESSHAYHDYPFFFIHRTFGVIDPGHPYIKHIYSGGNWLMGGEVELLGRIKYNDGLDEYRLTAQELINEFIQRGADAVFAFQTRNPTHAGHAYLMKTAREKLIAKGMCATFCLPGIRLTD